MSNHSPVPVFVDAVCRSFEINPKSSAGRFSHFELNKNVFESGTENPENLGFCPDGICTRSGLLNLTKCAETQTGFAAPVFISQPHFLNADRSLTDEIAGMEPDEASHQTYLVVDPLTGFIKNAAKRFQINIQTTTGSFF